jgi:hypothetical protein
MRELRFFPVIAGSSERKVAMTPTYDRATAERTFTEYLEELSPYTFRLHSKRSVSDAADIACPYCGRALELLSIRSDTADLSFLQCGRCTEGEGLFDLYR